MHKIWTLIKREYKETVYKKSFIFMTILTPVLMIALSVVPSLLMRLDSGKQVKLHIIDQSGFIYQPLTAALQDTLKDGRPKYVFTAIETANSDSAALLEGEKAQIKNEQADAVLYIPASVVEKGKVEFYAKNVADFSMNRVLNSGITKIVVDHRIKSSGMDPETIGALTKSIDMSTIKITKEGKESERSFMDEYFSTFVFIMILYMTLILHGSTIMRSIIQEKSSRIIEVLLGSSNPFQLMAGKIIGHGSVGLTQYVLWAAFGIGLVLFGGSMLPVSDKFFSFEPQIFLYFILFYLLGYLLYSSLFSAIGAISNSDQEAQQLIFPVIMLLIVPIMMLGIMVKAPDSTLITTLSMIPFFSPIMMFARINIANPPLLQVLGSIAILIVSIIIVIWLVARIFRVGILMYGKRPTLPEIIKWFTYK